RRSRSLRQARRQSRDRWLWKPEDLARFSELPTSITWREITASRSSTIRSVKIDIDIRMGHELALLGTRPRRADSFSDRADLCRDIFRHHLAYSRSIIEGTQL